MYSTVHPSKLGMMIDSWLLRGSRMFYSYMYRPCVHVRMCYSHSGRYDCALSRHCVIGPHNNISTKDSRQCNGQKQINNWFILPERLKYCCIFDAKSPLLKVRNCVSPLREFYTSSFLFKAEKDQATNDALSKKENEESETFDMPVSGRKDVILTIPNALTISRIILAPFLGYMVIQQSYPLACGMFLFAGVTDLLDGYIARRFPSQASSFGSYLDPLADKFLVSILFLSLTAVNLIPVALTGLVIIRDVILVGAAFYVRYISLPPPMTIQRYFDVTHATAQLQPTLISKLNTAVQLTLVATTLAAPVLGYVDHIALQSLWYLTAGTTIASGITYMFAKDTFKIIRETKRKKQEANEQS